MFAVIFLFFVIYIQKSNSLVNVPSDEFLGSTGKHLFHFVHVIIKSLENYVLNKLLIIFC
jgi:hypothetical protein